MREALFPFCFDPVPDPARQCSQSLAATRVEGPLSELLSLSGGPLTEFEAILAVTPRDRRVPLALDEPLQMRVALLPGIFMGVPYPPRERFQPSASSRGDRTVPLT